MMFTFTFMHLAALLHKATCIALKMHIHNSHILGNQTHDLCIVSAMLYCLSYRKDVNKKIAIYINKTRAKTYQHAAQIAVQWRLFTVPEHMQTACMLHAVLTHPCTYLRVISGGFGAALVEQVSDCHNWCRRICSEIRLRENSRFSSSAPVCMSFLLPGCPIR